MGQYHVVVNLTKREFIHPHKLGSGLKLWEQIANGANGGTGAALLVLLAASNGRGGGDLDVEDNWHGPERVFPRDNAQPGPMPETYSEIAKRTVGRWAGDQIAVVGDYAKDGDLPPEFEAEDIYTLANSHESAEALAAEYDGFARKAEAEKDAPERATNYRRIAAKIRKEGLFTDISDDVLAVLVHELDLKITDNTGWRQIERPNDHSDFVRKVAEIQVGVNGGYETYNNVLSALTALVNKARTLV